MNCNSFAEAWLVKVPLWHMGISIPERMLDPGVELEPLLFDLIKTEEEIHAEYDYGKVDRSKVEKDYQLYEANKAKENSGGPTKDLMYYHRDYVREHYGDLFQKTSINISTRVTQHPASISDTMFMGPATSMGTTTSMTPSTCMTTSTSTATSTPIQSVWMSSSSSGNDTY